jgi:hypothetical protein
MLTVCNLLHYKRYTQLQVEQQEALEKTNPRTFLTLFNNAVIHFKHFIQKLVSGGTQKLK